MLLRYRANGADIHRGDVTTEKYQEPEYAPWDARRVPLTFVAGYLGAGKTTLINHMLSTADRPLAVLVNDVGEINLDVRLIKSHDGDTIELTNGCVCCSMVDGFGFAFDELRAREIPPDHVVVELSGVAEPARMRPWGRSAGFMLDGVITLVAADQWEDLHAREGVRATLVAQVEAADAVVVTKTDLVDDATAARVCSMVHDVAPGVPIISLADPGAAASLLQLGGRRPGGVTDLPEPRLFDRHSTSLMPIPRPISRADLDQLLDQLPANTVRAKGIAIDPEGEMWLIQIVGRRRNVEKLADVEADGATDLVVITLD